MVAPIRPVEKVMEEPTTEIQENLDVVADSTSLLTVEISETEVPTTNAPTVENPEVDVKKLKKLLKSKIGLRKIFSRN